MALRPIDSLENAQKSVKKFFVDTFITGEGLHTDFGSSYHDNRLLPDDKIVEWLLVIYSTPKTSGSVRSLKVDVVIITRGDDQDTLNTRLRDRVFPYFEDQEQTDGLLRVPMYDVSQSPWVPETAMSVRIIFETESDRAEDGSTFRVMGLEFVWGV